MCLQRSTRLLFAVYFDQWERQLERWSHSVEKSMLTSGTACTAVHAHGTLLHIGQFHRTLRSDRVNPSRGRRPIGGLSMPTRLTVRGLHCGLSRPVAYQGPMQCAFSALSAGGTPDS